MFVNCSMVKISIIIPVYKVEPYIERCLRSVITQTYQGDIECILVDDCTPDRSMDIVQQILSSYLGDIEFKIVRHEKNKGLSAARNTGIKVASGEYLYFMDSDDEITPDAIESLSEFAAMYPEVEIIQGNLYASYTMRWLLMPDKTHLYFSEPKQIKKLMLSRSQFPTTAWNKLICKSFLLTHELWFAEGLIHEDEHWNFFAAKYIQRLVICPKPTYIYYLNSGSIMNSVSEKSKSSQFILLKIFIEHIDKVQSRIQRKWIILLGYNLLSNIIQQQIKPDWRKEIQILKQTMQPLLKASLLNLRLFEFIILLMSFYLPSGILKQIWKYVQRYFLFTLKF